MEAKISSESNSIDVFHYSLSLNLCLYSPIAHYQGPQELDSVLNFPLYAALLEGFSIPGPQNISAVTQVFEDSKKKFKVGLLPSNNPGR